MLMMMALSAAMMADQPPPPSEADFAAARQALNERMIDYPSARFRDVRGNVTVICGFVNGKNRLGAYAGWQQFAWLSGIDEPRLAMANDRDHDDLLIEVLCGEDGLKIESRDFTDRLAAPR